VTDASDEWLGMTCLCEEVESPQIQFLRATMFDTKSRARSATLPVAEGFRANWLRERPYMDFMPWIVTPTLTGCPSTTAPIGLTATGLPVAIQVMGPFWEDATPIEFARLLADEIGGFAAPPGYAAT
jgi:Amidase